MGRYLRKGKGFTWRMNSKRPTYRRLLNGSLVLLVLICCDLVVEVIVKDTIVYVEKRSDSRGEDGS